MIRRKTIIMAWLLSICLVLPGFAQSGGVSYEDIVTRNLKEMTKLSGTLDLYDSEADQIRNLRLIEIKPDIEETEDGARVPIRFRDINTGEIVLVEAKVKAKNGQFESKYSIKKIEDGGTNLVKREKYSDAEVQKEMYNYIDQQSRFTGYLMLFDPEAEKMRKLELVELEDEVRRYGILSISTSKFKDIDSGETLTIDINVKNNDGLLEVDALKIKKVKK